MWLFNIFSSLRSCCTVSSNPWSCHSLPLSLSTDPCLLRIFVLSVLFCSIIFYYWTRVCENYDKYCLMLCDTVLSLRKCDSEKCWFLHTPIVRQSVKIYLECLYFHFVIVTNIYSVNILIQNLKEFTYVRDLKICIQLAYLFHMRRGARFL